MSLLTIDKLFLKNYLITSIGYHSKGQSMSKDRVYQQLTSEYGEQFTEEEAQYAVDNMEQ
ncbi:Ltp family lipoprotein [Paraclostridium ghonii]|uniref:Ltp family lipoprotein n=1 Tax=Paraclostridium ghonii TaxID=29358 RepID=UPI0027D8CF44|nr:Ltp family lipoprotein [Paeniclostridium ghonii]